MKLNEKSLIIILVGILFSSVTLANVIGRGSSEINPQAATDNSGYFSTHLTPEDINESYTFGDIDRYFNILTPTLAQAFNLPAETNSTAFAIKDLNTIYTDQDVEIGVSSVRLFVALHNGLTYETEEQIYLPRSAVDILISRRVLLPEQIELLDAYALVLDSNPAPVSATINNGQTAERAIKGKTTFQEILDWGVSLKTIEQIIGGPLPSSQRIVKDYCTEKGLDFEEIKLVLVEEASKVGHNH